MVTFLPVKVFTKIYIVPYPLLYYVAMRGMFLKTISHVISSIILSYATIAVVVSRIWYLVESLDLSSSLISILSISFFADILLIAYDYLQLLISVICTSMWLVEGLIILNSQYFTSGTFSGKIVVKLNLSLCESIPTLLIKWTTFWSSSKNFRCCIERY